MLRLRFVGWCTTIAALFLQCYPTAAEIQFRCDPGRWSGATLASENGNFAFSEDGVTLPLTVYVLDMKNMTASMSDGKNHTVATIVHTYPIYTVVSYIYGNVHYTDTLYADGIVFSQLTKNFLGPRASTFYRQCVVFER